MSRLTEEMVIARSKQSDLTAVTRLNCWGAELTDVSLLRRMPNVEVLAFSINKINKLEDFAWCPRLKELYVRKNDIKDLSEIRHLRGLSGLHSLWLDENPCTVHPQYRMTVLRNLPNLEKLDNVAVQPEEVQEAMRRGQYIPDSDDEGYPQTQDYPQYERAASPESTTDKETYRRCEQISESPEHEVSQPVELVQSRLQSDSSPPAERYEGRQRPMSSRPNNDMTRSYCETRVSDEPTLRHSMSTHSVKEYSSYGNGDSRNVTSPQYQETLYERSERQEPPTSARCPIDYEQDRRSSRDLHASSRELRENPRELRESSRDLRESSRDLRESERELDRERDYDRERDLDRDYGYSRETREREREYPSAVMGGRRGFSRRPVTRNSNLLSALLCLVKELDYPSLEVAEMAIRCRMDELANGQ